MLAKGEKGESGKIDDENSFAITYATTVQQIAI